MAKKRKTKSKVTRRKKSGSRKSSGLQATIMPLAYGIAGAFLGNQISNYLDTIPSIAANNIVAPGITLAASIAGVMFGPEMVVKLAEGAAISAGTELLEKMVMSTGSNTTQAKTTNGAPLTLGFAQQLSSRPLPPTNSQGGQIR